MSRAASGDEKALLNAREAIASAQTVEQLRQAQAVVLPLDHGSRSSTVGADAELSHRADDVVSHPDQTRDRTNPRNFVNSTGSLGRRQNDRNWLSSTSAATLTQSN
jgi:hypothetical protein